MSYFDQIPILQGGTNEGWDDFVHVADYLTAAIEKVLTI